MRPPRIIPPPRQPSHASRRGIAAPVLMLLLLAALIASRTIASYVIDFQWWKEMGQTTTWFTMFGYQLLPTAILALLILVVLWMAHAGGLRHAHARRGEHLAYSRLSSLALLLLSIVIAVAGSDAWNIAQFFGSRGLPEATTAWRDPVFGRTLPFYLFDLPFYSAIVGILMALTAVSGAIYWLTARGWQIYRRFPELRDATEIDVSMLMLPGARESGFLRIAAALFFLALAARLFLNRYALVLNEHGFMTGADYVDTNIGLPLQWLMIAACELGAVLALIGRWKLLPLLAIPLVIQMAVPRIVSVLYVRPNEISLQRPYINSHIQATRRAFGLQERLREVEYKARTESRIQPARHTTILENARLWDWRAFHDTITQIQALRPYYTFADSDVDRYRIGGQLRQVLLSPRELDIRQLPDARTRWINPHFIYTHGYGMVVAEVAKITADGLPMLLIQDAPPTVKTPSLKLTRPEIYYGEVVHEPVFVRTGQQEFNYPAGSDNVFSRYDGKGGFPISSLGLRFAAAIREGDYNILLTSLLTPESRMMIHRDVKRRLSTLAPFIWWDPDPYLVVTEEGRLVWIVDGYTTSNAHPYSRDLRVPGRGRVNYIRNSVKATVDAYDGTTRLYVFENTDPIILSYQRLFPALFQEASAMPAGMREHTRYPETMFRIQAEIYRTFHMLDPQAFYNKEDLWDLARYSSGQSSTPEPVSPTYIMAALPGSEEPEFLLATPFTPRGKDNLIGLMVARCDGPRLGELVVLQLSKQELVFGPMQIAARINQDQNISKDLTLWNAQGSQVLRGQTLVLPIEDTFLYVEPIYIQATQARMPQLKKVVLAVGHTLIYSDTYEQALAELGGISGHAVSAARPPSAAPTESPPARPAPAGEDARLEKIRQHLRRYQELAGQGRWSEAGKELDALRSAAGVN